ncbi:MAG: hypothetical protein AAGD25_20375 [Cyanobacteria bacterium P01_F01_bin.150]
MLKSEGNENPKTQSRIPSLSATSCLNPKGQSQITRSRTRRKWTSPQVTQMFIQQAWPKQYVGTTSFTEIERMLWDYANFNPSQLASFLKTNWNSATSGLSVIRGVHQGQAHAVTFDGNNSQLLQNPYFSGRLVNNGAVAGTYHFLVDTTNNGTQYIAAVNQVN